MSVLAQPRPATGTSTGKIALFIVLASESVFFATALMAYVALRQQTAWPVQHTLERWMFPLANTVILLASTLAAWRATVRIREGRVSSLRVWLLVTLVLGLVFVAGQVFEFSRAGMHIDDEALGGVFFTLMGFHAAHVLAGVLFLVINLVRAGLGDFSSRRYEAVEIGNWFWFYVASVWLVLFAALYLL
jgi:heme/copper-type cytochrome/quinol oxidase subunit 3